MTILADCRSCGGKPAMAGSHHTIRHRPGCRYLARVQRKGQHGRATFPLSPSPLQARIVERHGPCPFDASRCAFCGFFWAGHPEHLKAGSVDAPVGGVS